MEGRITDVFEPYLNARDWVSINRGEEIAFTEDGFQRVGPAGRDRAEDR